MTDIMHPFDDIATGDEGDLDQIKDELLNRLQDEDAGYSVEERSQIERQLTTIVEKEYEVSKSEFDKFLSSDTMIEQGAAALTQTHDAQLEDSSESDPTALLEQALLNHDMGMDGDGDFGMDDVLPEVGEGTKPPPLPGKLAKQDSFDTFASAFTSSLDQLSIETDPFCGEDPFAACVLEPKKKAKRRKTSHERKPRGSRAKANLLKVKKEPKTPKTTRGTHRRTKSAETAATMQPFTLPKRAATPPPAGRIDKAENGRLIVRRGPRGKYTCGRCGARKEGHVCDVRVARSVESQVDLAITKYGEFEFNSPIKILTPGTWISTPDSITKQVNALPRAMTAA